MHESGTLGRATGRWTGILAADRGCAQAFDLDLCFFSAVGVGRFFLGGRPSFRSSIGRWDEVDRGVRLYPRPGLGEGTGC